MAALTLRRRRGRAPAFGGAFLVAFGSAALAAGAARAVTTTYLPVLLDRLGESPSLIGVVMLVNPLAGFAVPLAVGFRSDRLSSTRPRLPFLVGGLVLAAGGLAAVAAGTATSYALLALAGLAVYSGLNAAVTAHRAMVAEQFEENERPAATSAQEVAQLIGALAGVVAGGALIATAPWLLFLGLAAALPLVAAPTVGSAARLARSRPRPPRHSAGRDPAALAGLGRLLRRPGARDVLVAELLWVAAYVALPAFFVLYAEEVLVIGPSTSSLFLAGLGVVTGGTMVAAAARTAPERVYPRLVLGASLLGGGLLAAATFDRAPLAALPFAAAAAGFGLVTVLGFPYFARFVRDGEAGRYSGLYFSVRAVAAALALPLAGLLAALTGSYRAVLLLGAAGLLALVPLARARATERAKAPAPAPTRPPIAKVAAVIPCCASGSFERLAREALPHVDQVVVVDDGARPALAPRTTSVAAGRVRVLTLRENRGKGDAVAAGARLLLEGPRPPDAIVVLDCDGQHPPDRIPQLVAAAVAADVVIGDRRARRGSMPWTRRLSNRASSALLSVVLSRRVPDSQCGMRLYRRDALERVPLPSGRYEAETRHLKAAARAGLAIAWTPIPAIYKDGQASAFRPVVDSARVLAAILSPTTPAPALTAPRGAFLARWSLRLAALLVATVAAGYLAVPLLRALDEQLFVAVNSLGDGPALVYDALDPHTRNYELLGLVAVAAALASGARRALAAAFAVLVAAFLSDVVLQLAYLLYDRPRPEEALAAHQVTLSHGRTWAHIESFPSGHLAVTTAMAVAAMAAAPRLRWPLWAYVAAIGFTRVLFGSHFPLDVIVGLGFGYVVGRFSVDLTQAVRLLPGRPVDARRLALWPPSPLRLPVPLGAWRGAWPSRRRV